MISVLITSKNEPYLAKTITDLEENAVTDIEIIAEEDDGRGQRAMLNKLAEQAKGDILIKVDAHCAFGYEFDKILLEDYEDNSIIAPLLFPLYSEHWEVSHHKPMSNFVFDTNLVMQHGGEQPERVHETMCMQGSFFMVSKKNWFDWNLVDESIGSWGCQAVELGLKAWYNGGKCLTSKKTYYGHVFRHSDEEFPYKRNQKEIDKTYERFIKQFKNKDLGWLVEKFNYPANWTPEAVNNL